MHWYGTWAATLKFRVFKRHLTSIKSRRLPELALDTIDVKKIVSGSCKEIRIILSVSCKEIMIIV